MLTCGNCPVLSTMFGPSIIVPCVTDEAAHRHALRGACTKETDAEQ